MWKSALDGRMHRRALSPLEMELVNRPSPDLVQFPSIHDEAEKEYTMTIRGFIPSNMIAAIEKLHFDLAAQFEPLTEDMGEGGSGGMGGGGEIEKRGEEEL